MKNSESSNVQLQILKFHGFPITNKLILCSKHISWQIFNEFRGQNMRNPSNKSPRRKFEKKLKIPACASPITYSLHTGKFYYDLYSGSQKNLTKITSAGENGNVSPSPKQ